MSCQLCQFDICLIWDALFNGEELLTLTWHIVLWERNHFEQLLNLSDMYMVRVTEDSGMPCPSIWQRTLINLKKHFRGKARGMDGFCPEVLGVLNIFECHELSDPILKTEQSVCSSYWNITLLCLPGKSSCWKLGCSWLEPQIQQEWCCFSRGC